MKRAPRRATRHVGHWRGWSGGGEPADEGGCVQQGGQNLLVLCDGGDQAQAGAVGPVGVARRVPALGCYTLDGRDMENWGVPPDVRVENTPDDVMAGRDRQLERAVEELLRR